MKFLLLQVSILTLTPCIFNSKPNSNKTIFLNKRSNSNLNNLAPVDCPAIGYFLGNQSNGLGKTIPNKTGYCQNLKDICCGVNHQKGIENWWQVAFPTDQIQIGQKKSRSQIRKSKLESVQILTKEILKRDGPIQDHAKRIADSFGEESDGICKDASKRLINYDLPKDLLEMYDEESQKCWNFTNELQISMMCSACDPNAQKSLNFEKSEVVISKDSFGRFVQNCKAMIKLNTQILYPYFDLIEKQSKCDGNGVVVRAADEFLNKFSKKEILAADQFKFSIKLKEVSKMISFGTNLNINTEGDEIYLAKLLHLIKIAVKGEQSLISQTTTQETASIQKDNRLTSRYYTAVEIKQKFQNFVNSLYEEGNHTHENLKFLFEQEKKSLLPTLSKTEDYPKTESYINNSQNAYFQHNRNLQQQGPFRKRQSTRKLEYNEQANDDYATKLENRIKGIKKDIEDKYKNMSPRRFERTYPISKAMLEGTDKNPSIYKDRYKETMNYNELWKKDFHSAIIHYIECDDYDLYNVKEFRDGEELTEKEIKSKKECSDKVFVDRSIQDFIKKNIKYPPLKRVKVFKPGTEKEDDAIDYDKDKKADTAFNQKLENSLEDNLLVEFDKLAAGLDEKGKYVESSGDNGKGRSEDETVARRLFVKHGNINVKANLKSNEKIAASYVSRYMLGNRRILSAEIQLEDTTANLSAEEIYAEEYSTTDANLTKLAESLKIKIED